MKIHFNWYTVILIIVIILVGVSILSDNINEKNAIDDKPKKIAIFVDEKPNNINNLKEIKIATIVLEQNDELKLNVLINNSDIDRLNKAVVDIGNRPALKLMVENEKMINGMTALVMEEIGVLKNDINYIYAVRETLTVEFGFKAVIEK